MTHTCTSNPQKLLRSLCGALDGQKNTRGDSVRVRVARPFCLACAATLNPYQPTHLDDVVVLIQVDQEGREYAIPGTPWALVRRDDP